MQSESRQSTPTREQLVQWRVFLETAWAVIDVLDADLQEQCGLPMRWYDALVQIEETGDGVGMTELANHILSSKSGLTRVIDRMEDAGLVRRERPPEDRRAVKVFMTAAGTEALKTARTVHREGIQEHFVKHLSARELSVLASALGKVSEHVRPLRPGRISGR